GETYTASSIARDGFLHCSGDPESTLRVLEDYFASERCPILVLRIDVERVEAEVRFEAAAPLPAALTTHLQPGARFPHIYGALNLSAVTGVATVARAADGFHWPASFEALAAWS
ncbi:MAG TPA: DUF952 domain-containing protein, partial [Anaeromyxobacteraceae bacterium]|nr:DUF952 domain-containing protein [Anaeromyxobacteraceae bacterium]